MTEEQMEYWDKLLGKLGVSEDKESDDHQMFTGYARKQIVFDTWKISDDLEVCLRTIERHNNSPFMTISIYSNKGNFVPFKSEYLQFGDMYDKFPEHVIEVLNNDVPDKEISRVLAMVE